MANLKEDNTWEQGIYQFETSDPVMGGPNGIDNVPTRQLANRTLWLKNQLAAAVQSIGANKSAADAAFALKATTLTAGSGLTGGGTLGGNRVLSMGKPSKITATSTDEAVSDTHSHSIDKASTSVAGIVMLVNALNSTATDRALTAAQGKALADMTGDLGTPFQARGSLGTRNLDDLKELAAFGVWSISTNAAAKTELGYPEQQAGTLLVLPSAYQGMQIYIPFDWPRLYMRRTAEDGTWSHWRILGEVINNLTTASATAALSAAMGKRLSDSIRLSRPLVAGAETAITLNVASRASIIAALGDDYIPNGHNQLVLHNHEVSNITSLPIADKSPLQLDIYVMGGYSMIVATYMTLGRRFWTRANWVNESLGLSWVEDLTERNGVMLAGDQNIGGAKTFAARQSFLTGLQAASSKTDFDAGRCITLGANTNDAWIKNETSGKFFALKNSGELHYGGHKVYTAEYKPNWVNDITNKPTTVAASGLTDAATKTDVSNAATAVKNEILGGAGAAFDTLKELAAALGNDANFARTIADALAKKADKATTLAAYGLGDAIAVLTGTIADGGTIPLPAGFSEAQCKFMVSTSRDNPADIPWDIDESGRHVHYGYECTLNGRVVSCKAWLNKNRTTMGNAHPEIIVPGRANYLVIAYK